MPLPMAFLQVRNSGSVSRLVVGCSFYVVCSVHARVPLRTVRDYRRVTIVDRCFYFRARSDVTVMVDWA